MTEKKESPEIFVARLREVIEKSGDRQNWRGAAESILAASHGIRTGKLTLR
jgi:hypothetical protein